MGRRKIVDPLKEGLASRLYIAAFPRFRTTYEIAKMVVPGRSAWNSSGRILKLAEKFPTHFKIKTERVTRHKMRTLIMSEAQPFLSKLSETCQLTTEEVEALNAFEPNFRSVMDIYLELTLKRNPNYLALSLNAFEELSNALCLTLYMAKICSYATEQAKTFSFSMLGITLPGVLGAEEISNVDWVNFAKKLTNIASQQTITELYAKVRKRVSPTYEMAFTMLEGFEKYYKEFEKYMTKGA